MGQIEEGEGEPFGLQPPLPQGPKKKPIEGEGVSGFLPGTKAERVTKGPPSGPEAAKVEQLFEEKVHAGAEPVPEGVGEAAGQSSLRGERLRQMAAYVVSPDDISKLPSEEAFHHCREIVAQAVREKYFDSAQIKELYEALSDAAMRLELFEEGDKLRQMAACVVSPDDISKLTSKEEFRHCREVVALGVREKYFDSAQIKELYEALADAAIRLELFEEGDRLRWMAAYITRSWPSADLGIEGAGAAAVAKSMKDRTSSVQELEARAEKAIESKQYEEAFRLRGQIAQMIPIEGHPLADMSAAIARGSVGKPMDRMGVYFQGLDTGSLKLGTIQAARRRIQEQPSGGVKPLPKDTLWFNLALTHPARAELNNTISDPVALKAGFESVLGRPVVVQQHAESSILSYDKDTDTFSCEPDGFRILKVLEIQIPGIGKVVIHQDEETTSFYNKIEVILDESAENQGEKGLQNLHTILSLLGLGTALCPSRPEDERRMEMFVLLHAFFPQLSYIMERDPKNYSITVDELRAKIISQEPKAKELFEKYLDGPKKLFGKRELYSGRETYMIADMGDQVRKSACGLLFGTKCDAFGEIRSSKEGERETKIREMVKEYALGLKAGVAQYSNREDYVSRGVKIGGSTPEQDAHTGGLDSVFTRLIPKAFLGGKVDIKRDCMMFCYDGIRVLIDADVMGTASCYAHASDRFGARIEEKDSSPENPTYPHRLGLPEFAATMQRVAAEDVKSLKVTPYGQWVQSQVIFNEVMMRDLIPTEFVQLFIKLREIARFARDFPQFMDSCVQVRRQQAPLPIFEV